MLAKLARQGKRHLLKVVGLSVIALLIVIAVGVFTVGKYSHPIQKIHDLQACRTTLTASQKRYINKVAKTGDAYVKPKYYHYYFSPKRNLLIIQLGDSTYNTVQLAHRGNQNKQNEITQFELTLNRQSRLMASRDKKLGTEMLSPNHTMLYLSQNGYVKYSTLPTLQPTD